MTRRFDWSPRRKLYDDIQSGTPSPLEQCWTYGDAIAAVSPNEIRRGVIEIDGLPAATVQTAERRTPGGLRLVRLTRGPVTAQADLLPELARAIRSEYPRLSRNLLFWMPDTTDAAPAMGAIGKRQMTSGYTTAWLDLHPEPGTLRANLRGKWRNALNQAEADPPVLRAGCRSRDADLFIAGYLADRRAQKYSGPSGGLVRALTECFAKDVVLIQAVDHGDVIAASLFLRHGTSATYYLSWTTGLGREKNAAHLILWDALGRLRGAGVRWLDLGGMDARAPGLARFKLGLGADAVTYSGTWF